MGTADEVKARGRARLKAVRRAEREARRNRTIEEVKPQWAELSVLEQQLTAKVAQVTGKQVALIDQLRSEGMTANAIADALGVDVALVRRRMFHVVKLPSTKTQPLHESKS